jgi:2-keto-4-pentenoate hydratase/2-oxohepta-3-ene-1,7-dioic acid hydratase in catechol pathway
MNIFCIEQNYLAHKRERENITAGEPIIFIKPQSALLPTDTPFQYNKFDDNRLYAQCEIVLRISANGKDISEVDTVNYYDAISTGVNFTSIDIHDELNGINVPWEEAKAWNNSSMIGIWMPAQDFKNKKDINFCLYKNREMLQLGNSELMINDFEKIISTISRQHNLNAGDIIFTGTPVGIGEVFKGDQLEAFIEDDTVLEFEVTD